MVGTNQRLIRRDGHPVLIAAQVDRPRENIQVENVAFPRGSGLQCCPLGLRQPL